MNINSALLLFAIFIELFLSFKVQADTGYLAEIKDPKIPSLNLFVIDVTRTIAGDKEIVMALSKQNEEVALEEKAVLNSKTYEILEYNVKNYQTGEVGKLIFTDSKIWIDYTEKGKPAVKKEIEMPNVLVAPANFEQFIRLNFEKIKKEKNIVVDFLIWDRHETIPFKITYLGENKLNGENTQLFKMNVSNFLIAAFVEPIRVWYSQDMSQIKRYLGRVAVKQKNKDGSYSDLDADVLYRYK